MQPLRTYQARAIEQVRAARAQGARRILLVSPTGSGKTRMGEEDASSYHSVLWLAHRKELVRDASQRLRASMGELDVGVIAAGQDPSPHSRIQVSSVQTLLARGREKWPPAELVVLDECHHFAADRWSELSAHYSTVPHLGLTATPERRDGRAMGDIFDMMIVAAQYSELLEAGHLCQMRAYRPDQILANALAMNPTDAWLKHSGGGCGFAFFGSVDMAYTTEHEMNERGIRAAVIEQGTDKLDRARYIDAMRAGELDCICNVQTMTEGIDIPRASVVMLCSRQDHCGGLLQRAGRALRTFEGKLFARLIDLVGATHLHGLPTDDRIYSLEGDPIKRADVQPLKRCLKCGVVVHALFDACPECGTPFEAQARPRTGPRIYSLELEEVYAGKDTPGDAKRREYAVLRKLQQANGYDLYFVQKRYRELFGEDCIINDATDKEKRDFRAKMISIGKAKGWSPKFQAVMFKKTFGHWPSGARA